MHGGEGVGNSKDRRQVWERQMGRMGRGELQEEVGVKRASVKEDQGRLN